jgi:hypothetical protein
MRDVSDREDGGSGHYRCCVTEQWAIQNGLETDDELTEQDATVNHLLEERDASDVGQQRHQGHAPVLEAVARFGPKPTGDRHPAMPQCHRPDHLDQDPTAAEDGQGDTEVRSPNPDVRRSEPGTPVQETDHRDDAEEVRQERRPPVRRGVPKPRQRSTGKNDGVQYDGVPGRSGDDHEERRPPENRRVGRPHERYGGEPRP